MTLVPFERLYMRFDDLPRDRLGQTVGVVVLGVDPCWIDAVILEGFLAEEQELVVVPVGQSDEVGMA